MGETTDGSFSAAAPVPIPPAATRVVVQVELLRAVTRHLTTAEDFATVLQSITTAMVEQVGVTVAHIFLYLRDDECPSCRASAPKMSDAANTLRDLHLLASAGEVFPPTGPHRIAATLDTQSARLIRTPVPVRHEHVLAANGWAQNDAFIAGVFRDMGIDTVICYPLISNGEAVGAMGVLSRNPVSDEVFELLGIFADQAAIAIRTSLLFRELNAHKERLQVENAYLQDEIRNDQNFAHIVGESAALHAVLRKVRQVAGVETTVLLTGETGTGKELIARALHEAGPRKERSLIKINCGALPAGVVESELFGHEKGAFTGALQQRIGRFELADKGTLFMDEVGELPLDTQVKLLRVLQEQEFERVGGTRPMKVDVRLVAATNRDLQKEVAQGRFRADLYYRLNVFPIHVPSLRERPADIPKLVEHFLLHLQRKLAKPLKGVSVETMERLKRYPWPGNVRELQNVLERAAVLASGPIVSLQEPLQSPAVKSAMQETAVVTLAESERGHIRRALSETAGKIHGEGGAADVLGINPSTLRSRMKKLGISAHKA